MERSNKQSKTIRMPDDLVRRIQDIAEREHRTFSQQVNLFLDRYVSDDDATEKQVRFPRNEEESARMVGRT